MSAFVQSNDYMRQPVRPRALYTCGCCGIAPAPANPARRNFLKGGIAALGFAQRACCARSKRAQSAPATKRIDCVHHHYLPPVQAAVMAKHQAGALPPPWRSPQLFLADMEKAGVTTAVLSLMQPGVWFGNAEDARTLVARNATIMVRNCAATIRAKLVFIAAIPLPDTEGSLREIEYALDVLKADGIGLRHQLRQTNISVIVLPLCRCSRRNSIAARPWSIRTRPRRSAAPAWVKGLSSGAIEFATDTTRTIASLTCSAPAAPRSAVRMFASSGRISGGTLPFLIGRLIREQVVKEDPGMPDGPVPIVRKYLYEIAQGNLPGQFAARLDMVPASQLMFGSDFPFREGAEASAGFGAYTFSDAERARDRPRHRAQTDEPCCVRRRSTIQRTQAGAHAQELSGFLPDVWSIASP